MATDPRVSELKRTFELNGCGGLWKEFYKLMPYTQILQDCETRAEGYRCCDDLTEQEERFVIMVGDWT
jgi:hypothetical protein